MNKGVSAEALFDYVATTNKFLVSRPITDTDYDRIIEKNGKLWRVQIKMTSQKKVNGTTSYVASSSKPRGGRYGNKIDVIAIYVKPEDKWVIIPAYVIESSKIIISKSGKYSKYVNNWEFLK